MAFPAAGFSPWLLPAGFSPWLLPLPARRCPWQPAAAAPADARGYGALAPPSSTGVPFIPPAEVPADGTEVLRSTKQPAVWEGKYTVQKTAEISAEAEALGVLSLLMMLLLERRRG